VIRPWQSAPILTRMYEAAVGPVAANTSRWLITSLTGRWPLFFESNTAIGWR